LRQDKAGNVLENTDSDILVESKYSACLRQAEFLDFLLGKQDDDPQ
jgi:hypothetical protein